MQILLAVSRAYYEYLGVPLDRRLNAAALATLSAGVAHAAETDPYPSRYLHGVGTFPGILRVFSDLGVDHALCCSDALLERPAELLGGATHVDFQFAREVPATFVRALLRAGRSVSGWAPVALGAKQVQAALLQRAGSGDLVPAQIFVRREELAGLAERDLQWSASEFVIAKAGYSGNGRMLDGSDYLIFRHDLLRPFACFATARDAWFDDGAGLVLQELILSADPYFGGANGVLHKLHAATGLGADGARLRLGCLRIPAKFELTHAAGGLLPLQAVSRSSGWDVAGNLETYRPVVAQALAALFPLPRLFAFDFIARPDGRLAFLEANTHPATLATRLADDTCALGLYMPWVATSTWDASSQLAALRSWERHAADALALWGPARTPRPARRRSGSASTRRSADAR